MEPFLPAYLCKRIIVNYAGGECRLRGAVFQELKQLFNTGYSIITNRFLDRLHEWYKKPRYLPCTGYYDGTIQNTTASFMDDHINLEFCNPFRYNRYNKNLFLVLNSILSQNSPHHISCVIDKRQYPGGLFSNIEFRFYSKSSQLVLV